MLVRLLCTEYTNTTTFKSRLDLAVRSILYFVHHSASNSVVVTRIRIRAREGLRKMNLQTSRQNCVVITGSDMKERTLGEEESSDSMQSTVLAGHFISDTLMDDEYVEIEKDLTSESWNSLQSTVLAGNFVTSDSDVDNFEVGKDLTTVDEENLSKDDGDCTPQYEDILNICAIGSDDEAFFDCPSYSPRYSPIK